MFHYVRGLLLQAQTDHAAAIAAFERCVERTNNLAAAIHIGVSLILLGRLDEARVRFESARPRRPACGCQPVRTAG